MTQLKLSADVLALNPGVGKAIAVDAERATTKKARVPRADAQETDGLTTLLIAGWSTETMDGGRLHRLRQIWGARLETGWYETQSEACAEAKRIRKELGE